MSSSAISVAKPFFTKLFAFSVCSPREDVFGNGTKIIGLLRLASSKIEFEPALEITTSASAIKSFKALEVFDFAFFLC